MFSACHIVISSKCVHLLKCDTFLCLFKSNINVQPVPKISGFPFVTPRFPRLSLLSLSVHLNQGTTIAVHYRRSNFHLNHCNYSADNTYVASLSCYYISCICSPLTKATNRIATKYCMLQNRHNRLGLVKVDLMFLLALVTCSCANLFVTASHEMLSTSFFTCDKLQCGQLIVTHP